MKNNLTEARKVELKTLCDTLGVTFREINYLHQALTHTSFANEKKSSTGHNERLEFLGDAVLDLITSEYLFRRYPEQPEGELTKSRALIVCEGTLARSANNLGIGKYILLGKGEAGSGGHRRSSILADAFEAIIGAIYLDSGYWAAQDFVVRQLEKDIMLMEQGEYIKDYKTLLQEVVQKNGDTKIAYEITGELGPDHAKIFEVAVYVSSVYHGSGTGRSKKEAEQQAAKCALVKLNILDNN